MMRGHCEYEPIRDILEKPSFEKRKCKKHFVRQVKVTVNKSGQDFQNFVFPLFSEKKQLSKTRETSLKESFGEPVLKSGRCHNRKGL